MDLKNKNFLENLKNEALNQTKETTNVLWKRIYRDFAHIVNIMYSFLGREEEITKEEAETPMGKTEREAMDAAQEETSCPAAFEDEPCPAEEQNEDNYVSPSISNITLPENDEPKQQSEEQNMQGEELTENFPTMDVNNVSVGNNCSPLPDQPPYQPQTTTCQPQTTSDLDAQEQQINDVDNYQQLPEETN